jgi:hypothetical protein
MSTMRTKGSTCFGVWMADVVQNRYLESGSRHVVVGLFGEGWVHHEFSSLPLKIRESVLGKTHSTAERFPAFVCC